MPPEANRLVGQVPLFDLESHNRALREPIAAAIDRVVQSGQFIGGRDVEIFEQQFANYCGVRHAVGVGNGTDALVLALRSLGIGVGDEVITTSYSFVATAQAIALVGASPRFVDIQLRDFNLDPVHLEDAWTPRTRAILVVHLFGWPCDMDAILSFARRKSVPVIEDAAQAHGARYGGRRVGSLGSIGCFSFYPTKNLGAFGDAGAMVTDDAVLAERARALANHDRRGLGDFGAAGTNSRLDAIQAAVLGAKLPDLDERNARRRQILDSYVRKLGGLPLTTPMEAQAAQAAPHVFAIRVSPHARDRLARRLALRGVETRIYYPRPIPRMTEFQTGHSSVALDSADRASMQSLAIPCYPELGEEGVNFIAGVIREFFESDDT